MHNRSLMTLGLLSLFAATVLIAPYPLLVTALTILTVLSSGYFVFSWGKAITRSRFREETRVSTIGLIDFVGLTTMVFLYSSLLLVDIVQNGVPEVMDVPTYIRRVILYALLTLIAVVRTVRWIGYQRAEDGASVVPPDVRKASSEDNDALEGRK